MVPLFQTAAATAAMAATLAVSVLVPGTARSANCADRPAVWQPVAARVADSTLAALFDGGQAFPEFLEATRRRREGWHAVTDSVQIADSSLARARAVGGTWRLLVIAIDSCGDSMQQVPYAARFAELVPGLSLRIVSPTAGAAVQASHRSLDGRSATPTFVLLDADGRDAGCIVELPRVLRHGMHVRRDSLPSDALQEYKRDWYAGDRGAGIVHELVELLEGARDGRPVCERGAGAS